MRRACQTGAVGARTGASTKGHAHAQRGTRDVDCGGV